MLNKIAVAISLIAVMGGLGDSARAQTPSVSVSENRKVAVDRLIQSEMAARGIPGLQLSIVQEGKIVFTSAYGHANIDAKTPVTDHTIFQINSISKAFFGVAAMQLVEAGKLDLDVPVATYLKDLPAAWQGITPRQLLTHMSGLPEIIDDNFGLIDGATEADIAWAKVQAAPIKFQPGEKFEYCQTNYVVIGKIIEKLTGNPSSDFVRNRQFGKAKMGQTRFADTEGAGAAAKPPTASLYTYVKLLTKDMKTIGVEQSAIPLERKEPWKTLLLPAGGIQSSSTDLAKWVIALQKLKLVKQSSLEALWKPRPQKDGTYRGFNRTINGYGLGWPSVRRTAHPGIAATGGARAVIFIYPKDDLTVIVLTNMMGASPEKFADKIAAAYVPGLVIE